jgi:cysteinyl-tRNA synthetase
MTAMNQVRWTAAVPERRQNGRKFAGSDAGSKKPRRWTAGRWQTDRCGDGVLPVATESAPHSDPAALTDSCRLTHGEPGRTKKVAAGAGASPLERPPRGLYRLPGPLLGCRAPHGRYATPQFVYDTLTRQEREFEPVHSGEVRLYVCGMTVQDKPHIGHFLPFLTADIVRRYLEHRGFRVVHVQNFTDVDDKIIARARDEGVAPQVVSERNIDKFYEAARAMNLLPATHYPKATEHIPEIISIIQKLESQGFAYAAGGDVYFRVRRFPSYGALSGRDVDDLLSGARIEVGEQKEDPLDFALWKAAKPGEPQWPSPWGAGRPGWHIECSAMAMKYLGETLDMHGGGRDLIFPHHENERAQSEAASGRPFVRFWMHNGLLYTGGQKMSKSLGNFFLMEDILRELSPDEVRFYLLSTHFRSQAEFTKKRLEEARAGFQRFVDCVLRLQEAQAAGGAGSPLVSEAGMGLRDVVSRVRGGYFESLDHDFNTAGALGRLFELVREANRFLDDAPKGRDRAVLDEVLGTLRELLQLLGFFAGGLPRPETAAASVPAHVQDLAQQRLQARQGGDWPRADVLRRQIQELGYAIEDRADGFRLKPL